MTFAPTLTNVPAENFITLDEVKAHLRVEYTDDDTLLSGLISAATSYLDGYSGVLGRCLVTQTWEQSFEAWGEKIELPFPSCSNVVVKYFDTSNVEQTLSSSTYEVLEGVKSSYISWLDAFDNPSLYSDKKASITLTFDAGYGSAGDVPKAIWIAALMLIAHWYDEREAASINLSEIPFGVRAMLEPYSRIPL